MVLILEQREFVIKGISFLIDPGKEDIIVKSAKYYFNIKLCLAPFSSIGVSHT
jgi:hypothetical protein